MYNQGYQNDWQVQQRGRRWLWAVNSGVTETTSKGHRISEMDPKEVLLRKGKFHSASKQMPKEGLFLILLTLHCTDDIIKNKYGRITETPHQRLT